MTDTQWLSDDENRLWRAYLDTTHLLFQELDHQLVRDGGISFADYEILVFLAESPEMRLRMSELAGASALSRSGATRAVARLEKAGWVRRVQSESDKRGAWAELTDHGAEKLAAMGPGHVAAVRTNMFDPLDRGRVSVMARGFAEMREHILGESGRNAVSGRAVA